MTVIITRDLTMCVDCAQVQSNGVDANDDSQREHALRMFHHTADWRGTIVVDRLVTKFSSRHCDTCGTTLAGARYSGALLEPERRVFHTGIAGETSTSRFD